MGFEPTISCVTGRRALRCSTRTYYFKYPEQESNLQTLGSEPSRSAGWRIWASSVIPDGIEPSFPGCEPSVVAVGPRDGVFQWTHPESHRDLRLATPASSCWTMSPCSERRFARKHAPKDLNPDQLVWNQSCCHYTRGVCCFSGSRETRTHKRFAPPPVFKTGSSSGRMTSVLSSCGSWNRTNGLLVQSQASLPSATTPQCLSF